MERDPAYLLDMLNDMRNHLVHRYFRIDLPLVWDVICNHIAPLITQLEPLVPPESP